LIPARVGGFQFSIQRYVIPVYLIPIELITNTCNVIRYPKESYIVTLHRTKHVVGFAAWKVVEILTEGQVVLAIYGHS
jgi:hypothetical protein